MLHVTSYCKVLPMFKTWCKHRKHHQSACSNEQERSRQSSAKNPAEFLSRLHECVLAAVRLCVAWSCIHVLHPLPNPTGKSHTAWGRDSRPAIHAVFVFPAIVEENDRPNKNARYTQKWVWCGMTTDTVVGPYLLHDTMNGERYLKMLQEYVWPIVSRWENINEVIFM